MTPGVLQQVRQLLFRCATSLRLEVDTWSIHFTIQEAKTLKPSFIFLTLLYCGVDSPSVCLAVHFLFILLTVIKPWMIRMGHVAHVDENRYAYCTVMRKPEGKVSVYVKIILK
jgi:hypothetical protein